MLKHLDTGKIDRQIDWWQTVRHCIVKEQTVENRETSFKGSDHGERKVEVSFGR
jgi:hypothetical protein